MERVLLPYEKALPSTSCKYLAVTLRIVDNPESELPRILNGEATEEQEEKFRELSEGEAQRLKESLYIRKNEFLNQYGLLWMKRLLTS